MTYDNKFRLPVLMAAALSFALALGAAERTQRDGLMLDGMPAADPALDVLVKRLGQGREARFMDWLPDGSLLIATRLGTSEQLHRVSAPLGMRTQLSYFGDAVLAASGQPYANDAVAVLKQNGSDSALHLLRLDNHEPRVLVEASARPGAALWAHDGRRLVFQGRQRNGRDADLYVLDTNGGLPQLVASGIGELTAFDWSLDDRQLLAVSHDAVAGDLLQLLDTTTGTMRALDPPPDERPERRRIVQARFAPSGRGIFYLTDQDHEYVRLRYIELDGSGARDVTPALGRDIERFDLTADGRWLAYSYPSSAGSTLVLVDQRAGLERAIGNLPSGWISTLRFDRSGKRLALNLENSQTPRDVYVIEADTGAATRWTQSEPGPLSETSLVKAEPMRYPTWDRRNGRPRELTGLIYRPRAGSRHPVLICLPNGDGQVRDRYEPLLQTLVQDLGYAIVIPTLRGAAGQGRGFAALDDGALRNDAMRDVGSLLVWVGAQSDLDRDRIAIMGSGGTAPVALNSLAQYGDRLHRAIVVDGPIGDAQLQVIRRPVLIVQGAEEQPLLQASAEQMLWRMRNAGGTASLVSAGDRPAANAPTTALAIRKVMVQFLQPLGSGR